MRIDDVKVMREVHMPKLRVQDRGGVELVVVAQHVLLCEGIGRIVQPNDPTCSDRRLVRTRVPKKETVRGMEIFVHSEVGVKD